MPDVEIIESTPIKKGDYRVVLGFAGAGFIGNTAVMYIARSKGFKLVALVRSSYVPPMTLIIEGNPTSSFRIYVDEAMRLLFVITESMIPAEGCYAISRELMKWLMGKGAKEIYITDGLPFSATSSAIKVLGYSNKIDLSKHGIQSIREGALQGLNSCVMEECLEKGVPFAYLFIPTNKLTSIDYGGSAEAIEVLNKLFMLGVDASPLRGSEDAQRRLSEQKQSGLGKVFKRS
jgi:uncharacterized protein